MTNCLRTGERSCKCLNPLEPHMAFDMDIRTTLRKLFSDHGVYTVFVLKSIVDKTPDTQVFLTRLLGNQKDIGDQLKPIVGDKVGNLVTKVLTEHIKLAGEVMKSAVNKDKMLDQKIQKLFANSDQVANVLHFLNSQQLPLEDMKDMFHEHNNYVIKMTVARIKKDYKEEQVLFDSYFNELLEMSDMIAHAL
jgi:hypothetical protein